MKFIHTADIHYGMKPDITKFWTKERENDIKNSFKKVIDSCVEYNVDFLFISGDLFHSKITEKDIRETNYLFSKIEKVKIIIILGNHDYYFLKNYIDKFIFNKNVYILKNDKIDSIFFKDLNTRIYGFSYHEKEILENRVKNIKIENKDNINILMLHGGDKNHLPFEKEELLNSGFSYIALGHIHKKEIFKGNYMAYPGSLEALDNTESGKHGFLFGEIDDLEKKIKYLKFIESSKINYISLTLKINKETTSNEIIDKIIEEIKKIDLNNIYKIYLKGYKNIDFEFNKNLLPKDIKIYDVYDETEYAYNIEKIKEKHKKDIIGIYIENLKDKIKNKKEEKAFYYGLNAILKNVKERD